MYLVGTKCGTLAIEEDQEEAQKPEGHIPSRSRIECLGCRPTAGVVMKPGSTPLAEKLSEGGPPSP